MTKPSPSLSCGACNLCCKLLEVKDIGKPARMSCWWTTVHGGCFRHSEKATAPELAACHQWECVWLNSQKHEDVSLRQPRHLRPDMTHVVLGPQDPEDRTLLYVNVDPDHPSAWKKGPIATYLQQIVERGGKLEIIVGDHPHVKFPAE